MSEIPPSRDGKSRRSGARVARSNDAEPQRRAFVEEVERRILLSAELGPFADLVQGADPTASAEIVDLGAASDTAGARVDVHVSRELVFVDAGVEEHRQLVEDLRSRSGASRAIEVVVLERDRDGIEQIGEVLAGLDYALDAVHVVSHGTDAGVQLGTTWLDARSLAERSDGVSGWGKALGEDADLLLYGCNLAGSVEGQALVDALAELTGADVAASVDATGAAVLGGDWDLEYAAGSIETSIAFSEQAQSRFAGLLDSTSFQQGVAGYVGTLDTTADSAAPDTAQNAQTIVHLDISADAHGLIRFDDLFGSGPGQIPVGSTIDSASLTVDVTDSSAGAATISLHRMLVDWDATSTWNSLGSGIQTDDTEAVATPDDTLSGGSETTSTGPQTFTGLEATVQAWLDGDPNYGWTLISDHNNDWNFASSEDANAANRPQLSVTYTAPLVVTAPTVSATGPASVPVGSTYTLNLAATGVGSDPITSWSINWGDGTIDTVAGHLTSVDHVYSEAGFTQSISVAATNTAGTWTNSDLIVGTFRNGSENIHRFDGSTGDFIETFDSSGGDLDRSYNTTVGPDGNFYVSGFDSNNIVRFDATGAYLGEFIAPGTSGLDGPEEVVFGPDGTLFVSSYESNQILRFDTDGSPLGVFGSGGALGGTDRYGVRSRRGSLRRQLRQQQRRQVRRCPRRRTNPRRGQWARLARADRVRWCRRSVHRERGSWRRRGIRLPLGRGDPLDLLHAAHPPGAVRPDLRPRRGVVHRRVRHEGDLPLRRVDDGDLRRRGSRGVGRAGLHRIHAGAAGSGDRRQCGAGRRRHGGRSERGRRCDAGPLRQRDDRRRRERCPRRDGHPLGRRCQRRLHRRVACCFRLQQDRRRRVHPWRVGPRARPRPPFASSRSIPPRTEPRWGESRPRRSRSR